MESSFGKMKFLPPMAVTSIQRSPHGTCSMLRTVQQPQDNFAGHGAGVPPLPCLAVPTDIGNQPPPTFTNQNR